MMHPAAGRREVAAGCKPGSLIRSRIKDMKNKIRDENQLNVDSRLLETDVLTQERIYPTSVSL